MPPRDPRTRSTAGRRRGGRLRVLVAGGGVAAVEALLALRELAPERVEPMLLAPNPDFVYSPLAVAAPFGGAEPPRIPLAEIAADTGATLRRDSLAGIGAQGTAQTTAGDLIEFDALLIATGVRRLGDIPGAITYRGGVDNDALSRVLRHAERGRIRRLAFAVPASARWTLPIYDLVLLSAARLRKAGSETRISLITHEVEPLGVFGRRASRAVEERLAEAGIVLRRAMSPIGFRRRTLELASGTRISADAAIALPRLEVPRLAGVPQGPRGFIGTDLEMRVEGLARVYAAGDTTWFPLKQGGIAAQQADVAALKIAALAGADVEPEPFRPVLRAAILTGAAPLYLRSVVGARQSESAASSEPLWWPPAKIAGKHLSAYLRKRGLGEGSGATLEDLEAPIETGGPTETGGLGEAGALLLAADDHAAQCDFRGALRCLQAVEDLEIVLPEPYGARKARWQRAAADSVPRPQAAPPVPSGS